MKKFFGSLDFQGWLWLLFPVLLAGYFIQDFSGRDYDSSKHNRESESYYESDFDSGYQDGYEDGYANTLVGAQGSSEHAVYYDPYDYFSWKDIVCEIAPELEQDAVHYVREESEWHPEEAMMIVEAYENQEPFWEDGSPPSHDDYQDAVHSLYRFYEYFYNAEYRN